MNNRIIYGSVLVLVLAACGGTKPVNPPPGGGSSTVSGLLIFPGQVGNPPPAPPSPTPPPPSPPTPPSPPPAAGTFSGTLTVPSGSGGSVQDTFIAACVVKSSTTFDCADANSKGGKVTSSGASVNFTISNLAAVQYVVYGWKDVNSNGGGQPDAGDYFTFFGDDGTRKAVAIQPPKSGVNLPMYTITGTNSLSISSLMSSRNATIQSNAVGINTNLSNNLNAQTQPEFVPGEVIVKFRDGIRSQGISSLQAQVSGASVNIARVRSLGSALPRTELYRASTDAAGTLEMARQLSQRSDVEYAEPNYISHIQKAPNDPNYAAQWHYKAMNLENAWDITDGTGKSITVSVVDTGKIDHTDLQGTFVGGYDFITDPDEAGDGDARDADATDLGGDSGYHGSHVAGTIAAQSNNGVGVAGVNWGAKVVPVRVLGINGSGTNADILPGVQWAAGIHVDGVPDNPNPAKVINLSLGGKRSCSQAEQDLYDDIKAKGVIVVVAAGNSNEDANNHSPASCNNVITVGATGPTNTRAPYSNYGSPIDVMAPGGDTKQTITFNGKTYPAGVLSTLLDDQSKPVYGFYQGTSMASPHVAGLVSLMLSKDSSLSFDTIMSRLKAASTPLSPTACNRPSGSDCGPGLVDAARALGTTGTTPPPPGPTPPPPTTGSLKTYVIAAKCASANDCKTLDEDSIVYTEVQAESLEVSFKLTGLSAGTYIAVGIQDVNGNIRVDKDEPAGAVGPFSVGDKQNLFGLTIRMKPFTPASAQSTVASSSKLEDKLRSLAANYVRNTP
jgi:serine protease